MLKFRTAGANDGAKQPSLDLADLSQINPDFADYSDDQIEIDLSFIRKIKVILNIELGNIPGFFVYVICFKVNVR